MSGECPSPPARMRIAIDLPAVSTGEIVAILDVLDQLVAQLWREHGDEIADFMIRDRRRKERERAQRDFPF